MEKLLKVLTNTKSLMALVGTFGLLANQFGLGIDIEWLEATMNLVCTILIILGVANNEGMDTVHWNK